jgi:DNA helicase-2/ATP-dependent DNA helicase PcrA
MNGLNPTQLEAVNTLSGPVLVLAGAGTGKTRVVTYRVANLIKHGTPADRILAVTFTNKAAAEMQERISQVLGRKQKKRPVIATFHSLALRILRRHLWRLGYPQRFAICDRGDQESIARRVLKQIRVHHEQLKPSDFLFRVSRWKSESISPAQAATIAENDKEHLAAIGYRRYQQELKNSGAVDFDDLLLCTEEIFSKFEDARHEEAALFDHLLVDEYQDTNASQYRIVSALAAEHRNLFVVGDDDQSIYAWRGADVEHILRFKEEWADAQVVRLEQNYRSTAEILELANRLIKFNSIRHEKELQAGRSGGPKPEILQFPDETKEAAEIVNRIARRATQKGIELSDMAILFRTNEQPRVFETELRKQHIPYILLGSSSFFDRKEIRDVLAYLKVITSKKDDISLLRILNQPPRGIGHTTIKKIRESAAAERTPIWEKLSDEAFVASLPASSVNAVRGFIDLINRYRHEFRSSSLADTTRSLIAEINYFAEVEREYKDENERGARWASVEQLVNAVSQHEQEHEKPSLYQFLDDTFLDGTTFETSKEKKLNQNAVALLTLHSAKGLEYPEVYMVGLEEGILPHRRSVDADDERQIAEERRLCYVGLTRAQERLTLSLCLSRMKWGKPRPTQPSRFLFEMIGQAERAKPARPRRSQNSSARKPAGS